MGCFMDFFGQLEVEITDTRTFFSDDIKLFPIPRLGDKRDKELLSLARRSLQKFARGCLPLGPGRKELYHLLRDCKFEILSSSAKIPNKRKIASEQIFVRLGGNPETTCDESFPSFYTVSRRDIFSGNVILPFSRYSSRSYIPLKDGHRFSLPLLPSELADCGQQGMMLARIITADPKTKEFKRMVKVLREAEEIIDARATLREIAIPLARTPQFRPQELSISGRKPNGNKVPRYIRAKPWAYTGAR